MRTKPKIFPHETLFTRIVILILTELCAPLVFSQTTKEIKTNQERGVDLNLYFSCWQDADSQFSHGGLLERPVLTAGDPQHIKQPGAVLIYAKKFSRAVLEPHSQTKPTEHVEQEILYIVTGTGTIVSAGRKAPIENGTAVLLPPNLTHTLHNEGSQPMEILIVTEEPPTAFKPRADMLVRYLRELPVTHISHWSYAVRWLFKEEDGLAKLSNLLIVTQDAMTIGSPHAHIPLWEEVWYKIEEDSLLFVGSEVRKMPNGCGYIAPPDGETPHSVINVTDKPQRYFYFAYYKLDKK